MLVKEELRDVLVAAVSTGTFPANGVSISNAIRAYVMAKGTQLPPTISYTLAPCSGAGWLALIGKASSSGVAPFIISDAISVEFAASMKVIPAPTGVQTVPMVFNTAAQVKPLNELTDFNEVWLYIAEAVINFFKTEIN